MRFKYNGSKRIVRSVANEIATYLNNHGVEAETGMSLSGGTKVSLVHGKIRVYKEMNEVFIEYMGDVSHDIQAMVEREFRENTKELGSGQSLSSSDPDTDEDYRPSRVRDRIRDPDRYSSNGNDSDGDGSPYDLEATIKVYDDGTVVIKPEDGDVQRFRMNSLIITEGYGENMSTPVYITQEEGPMSPAAIENLSLLLEDYARGEKVYGDNKQAPMNWEVDNSSIGPNGRPRGWVNYRSGAEIFIRESDRGSGEWELSGQNSLIDVFNSEESARQGAYEYMEDHPDPSPSV